MQICLYNKKEIKIQPHFKESHMTSVPRNDCKIIMAISVQKYTFHLIFILHLSTINLLFFNTFLWIEFVQNIIKRNYL